MTSYRSQRVFWGSFGGGGVAVWAYERWRPDRRRPRTPEISRATDVRPTQRGGPIPPEKGWGFRKDENGI